MKIFVIPLVLRICNSIHYRWYRWYNPLKFKSYGVAVGIKPRLLGSIYLKMSPSSKCVIGDNVEISSGHSINPLTRNIRASIALSDGAFLSIGDNSGMSSTVVRVRKSIRIGNNVKIGGVACFLIAMPTA